MIYLVESGDNKAFWFRNEILYEVDGTHIGQIINDPEKFGISKNEIEEIYKKYDEPVGFEGYAREDIIKLIAKNGWIRIRHYRTPRDYWSIQFSEWNLSRKQISKFVGYAITHLNMHPDDAINLIGYDDGYNYFYSTLEGGAKNLLEGKFYD